MEWSLRIPAKWITDPGMAIRSEPGEAGCGRWALAERQPTPRSSRFDEWWALLSYVKHWSSRRHVEPDGGRSLGDARPTVSLLRNCSPYPVWSSPGVM